MLNKKVDYSSEVRYANIITSIAQVAAKQVDGVASVTYEAGSVFDSVKAKQKNKCIVVNINKNFVIITISINAYYNYSVPVLVSQLQEKIKQEVEKATNYSVKYVNVNVIGVVFKS
ncbi:MAG: Asp23/Gls24 family envelope stress response protein [Clostridia bacterium]